MTQEWISLFLWINSPVVLFGRFSSVVFPRKENTGGVICLTYNSDRMINVISRARPMRLRVVPVLIILVY